MSNADFTRCKNRLLGVLNLADEDADYSSGTIQAFAEFRDGEIEDALFEADAYICNAIISNLKHPFRNAFAASTPTTLNSGDAVPAHMGASDKVECRLTNNSWVPGRLVKNRTRLQEIASSTATPSDRRQSYYCREGGHIYTAGTGVRVYVPVYTQSRSPNILKAPLAYESGVIAFAAGGLFKGTTERGLHDYYYRQALMLLSLVGDGATNLPDFERHKKEGR